MAHATPGNPRRSAVVRLTHWATTVSFFGLLVSGAAILLAHPRLYWGETGAFGVPPLINLPLPLVLNGQSGWGRSLHFLSAWIAVATGLVYVVFGLSTPHFRTELVPTRTDLSWAVMARVARDHVRLRRPGAADALTYNVLQRLTYLAVIFVFFPIAIWTGLAMSPAVTSVVPVIVTALGGQQSARTIHFFDAALLTVFVAVHVGMVYLAGFRSRMRGMLTGRVGVSEECA